MNKEAALVVFSGGQDSTTCLFWAKREFKKVYALSFLYGQKHRKEVDLAREIARKAGVEFEVMDVSLIGKLGRNSLTDTGMAMDEEKPADSFPNTFVPGRNLFFLSIAAVYAREKGINHIVAGVSQTDFSGYPDCRDTFIKSLNVTPGEDGEEVHVGWNGIHVEDPKEDSRIHIDGSGVFVDDKKYDQEEWRKIRKEKGWDYYYEDYTKFPFALLAIIAYIGIALYTELWHPLWIFLLIVPIIEGAISAVKHRNLNRFPYPVLVILYFLYEGFYENIWSPTWLIFLTIPVYYSLVNYFRQRKQHKNNNCTDNQED